MKFAALILTPFMMLASTTIQGNVCHSIMTPTITSPKNGSKVKAGNIFVAGAASSAATVSIKVDGTIKATTTASSTNRYGATVALNAGKHTIQVESSTPCEKKTSSSITVTATNPPTNTSPTGPTPSTTPSSSPSSSTSGGSGSGGSVATNTAPYQQYYSPSEDRSNQSTASGFSLTIDSSLDGSTVTDSEVYVSGTLSRSGVVEILDESGTVIARLDDPALLFGFTLPLEIGANTFTIRAKSGETEVEKQITITRSAGSTEGGALPTSDGEATTSGQKDEGSMWRAVLIGAGVIIGGLAIFGLWQWFLLAAKRRKEEEEQNNQFGG